MLLHLHPQTSLNLQQFDDWVFAWYSSSASLPAFSASAPRVSPLATVCVFCLDNPSPHAALTSPNTLTLSSSGFPALASLQFQPPSKQLLTFQFQHGRSKMYYYCPLSFWEKWGSQLRKEHACAKSHSKINRSPACDPVLLDKVCAQN